MEDQLISGSTGGAVSEWRISECVEDQWRYSEQVEDQ
jgi:hypothetical protein